MMASKVEVNKKLIEKIVTLNLVFHNLNKRAERKLGISLVQYHFLNTLRDMPACSPLTLAKKVGMHPSSLTQSIKRLEKRNMIYVGDDPKDSRKKILSLTLSGRDALENVESRIDSMLKVDQKFYEWLKP